MRMTRTLLTLTGIALTAIMMTGCDDDDSSGSGASAQTGTGVVRGQVTSAPSSTVPAAVSGNVGGILVTLTGAGIDLTTTTDANGVFQFTELPAGEFTITFMVNGKSVTHTVSVEEDRMTLLSNITIDENGNINVASNVVTGIEEDDDDPMNVAGDWSFNQGVAGAIAKKAKIAESLLHINQDGNQLSGTLTGYTFVGTIDGNTIEFTFTQVPAVALILQTATGTVNDDGSYMSGTYTSNAGTGTWTATPGAPPVEVK